MKYMQRAGVYKAANVTFDPRALSAKSYDWWRFVKPMGQLVVFNSYRYSTTTARHQWKVKHLMAELGIQIHATIESPQSLNHETWAQGSVSHYQRTILSLSREMLKGRPAKNLERAAQIKELEAKIKQVKVLARMDKVPV